MYKYILILHGLSSDLVCPRHQHRRASFILMLIKVSCLEWRTLFSLLWSYFYHPQAELAHMISRLSLSDLPTESRGPSPIRCNLVVLWGSRPHFTVYIGRWEWDVKRQFLEAWVTAAVWLVFPQPPYRPNFSANTFLSNCLVFVRRELGEGVASLLVFGIYPLQKLTWIASIHMVFIQATVSAFTDSSCIIRNMHQLLMLQYNIFLCASKCQKNCLETSVHTWAWQVRWRM